MTSGRGTTVSASGILVSLAFAALALLPGRALAAFHLMEIEQVIAGVNGDPSAQAIQLKMRAAGQQFVTGNAQLVVRDAAGANPVVLSSFPAPNPVVSGACLPILLATNAMAEHTSPPLDAAARDFAMNPIPPAYLAAGTLTFEQTVGSVVYWRLSWGGATYTGPHTVIATPAGNDNDGNAGPAYAGALPTAGGYALRYTPACPTASTTNASQYALTSGAAQFQANDLATFDVLGGPLPEVSVLPSWMRILLAAALGSLALLFARSLRGSEAA
jgi:hypothetical protein